MFISIRINLEMVLAAVSRDDNTGFCVACGFEHCGGCEPDMRRGKCDSCGEMAVYGAEELLLEPKFALDPYGVTL